MAGFFYYKNNHLKKYKLHKTPKRRPGFTQIIDATEMDFKIQTCFSFNKWIMLTG